MDTHKGGTQTAVADTIKSIVWSDSTTSNNNFADQVDNIPPQGNASSKVTWTVPSLDKLSSGSANEGWVQIKAIIDDVAPIVGEGETGSRDDEPLELRLLVSVTGPKIWKRAQDENVTTNIEAKIIKPIDIEMTDTSSVIFAKAGDSIEVGIRGSDIDYWTREAPSPTNGKDSSNTQINRIKHHDDFAWSAKSAGSDYGSFDNTAANSTTYHIPNDAKWNTKITVTGKADDQGYSDIGSGDEVPDGDSGSRDDDPVKLSFTIKISKDPDIQSIEVSPQNPITSGFQNNPAATLKFTAKISDPENKVTSVHWSWGDQTHEGSPWRINAVPYDKEHGSQTVTCTIYWDDNGAQKSKSRSKKFKLFFDHSGHDESDDTTYGKSDSGAPLNPPNWFDDASKHWGQVMVSKISGLSSLKNAGRFFYTNTAGGNHSGLVPTNINNSYQVPVGSVLIAPAAGGSISPQLGYVYTARTFGIDSFGAIIMHEMRHRWQLQQSWGITDSDNQQTLESKIGPNGSWIFDGTTYDKDADGMKDSWESLSPEQGGWGQDPDAPDKFLLNGRYDGNTFEQDNEFDADMNGARNWQIGSVDDQDWANNGKQSEQG